MALMTGKQIKFDPRVNDENVRKEERCTGIWRKRYGESPERARSVTFDRLGEGSQHRAAYHKFCSPTGLLRPGIDPLPHHYGLQQNRGLLRATILQHNEAMARVTKIPPTYDPARDTSYMSPSEVTAKDPDFLWKVPNRLFDTSKLNLPQAASHGGAKLPELTRRVNDVCCQAVRPRGASRGTIPPEVAAELRKTRAVLMAQLKSTENELKPLTVQRPKSQIGELPWRRTGPYGDVEFKSCPGSALTNWRSPFAAPYRNQITHKKSHKEAERLSTENDF